MLAKQGITLDATDEAIAIWPKKVLILNMEQDL